MRFLTINLCFLMSQKIKPETALIQKKEVLLQFTLTRKELK
jgi:hypothetical protein